MKKMDQGYDVSAFILFAVLFIGTIPKVLEPAGQLSGFYETAVSLVLVASSAAVVQKLASPEY